MAGGTGIPTSHGHGKRQILKLGAKRTYVATHEDTINNHGNTNGRNMSGQISKHRDNTHNQQSKDTVHN